MIWSNPPNNISQYAGFVYLITNIKTDQRYIGKKFFWANRSRKVKGLKNRKWKKSESNWKNYKSSSKLVHVGIDKYGINNFRFEILQCYKTRREVNYHEMEFQVIADVLGMNDPNNKELFYNANILRKFFK